MIDENTSEKNIREGFEREREKEANPRAKRKWGQGCVGVKRVAVFLYIKFCFPSLLWYKRNLKPLEKKQSLA